MIVSTSLEECVARIKAWKEGMQSTGLLKNKSKTKYMASGVDLDVTHGSGKFPVMCVVLELERHP